MRLQSYVFTPFVINQFKVHVCAKCHMIFYMTYKDSCYECPCVLMLLGKQHEEQRLNELILNKLKINTILMKK